MPEAIWISFAFVIGLLVKGIGLPPLVGYLAAGFVLSGLSATTSITAEPTDVLAHIAHLGVLLLLFTVGLKLKLRSIVSPEVIGGSLLHFAITCVVFAPGLYLLFDLDWTTALMLAIALSFSSTVLAAKVLESKRELRAFHGRVAIGILIMQDLIALVVMSLAAGKTPSEWAVIVFGLPLLRPLLYRLLDASGHDELLVLLGLLLALVVGGLGFEAVGLSSELGALVFGAMLANHPRSQELAKSLWSVKEIFLVGFFLQIGIDGLPDQQALIFAAVAALLLPLKGILFYFLLLASSACGLAVASSPRCHSQTTVNSGSLSPVLPCQNGWFRWRYRFPCRLYFRRRSTGFPTVFTSMLPTSWFVSRVRNVILMSNLSRWVLHGFW